MTMHIQETAEQKKKSAAKGRVYRSILAEVIKAPGHAIEAFNKAEGKESITAEEAYEIIALAEAYEKNTSFAAAVAELIPEGGREI